MMKAMTNNLMNQSMGEEVRIDQAGRADLERLWGMSLAMKQGKMDGYFERCLERQRKGELAVFIIHSAVPVSSFPDLIGKSQKEKDRDPLVKPEDDGRLGGAMGYCVLNWVPKYGPFKKLGIPEIQDLNVLPDYRQRGLATKLIAHCEEVARSKGHEEMGIGVGMNRSFGAAQRLYVKLGYVPDGQGINYDRIPLESGKFCPNDDQLCLMMVKRF